MDTLAKNSIYISLSRWLDVDEEHKGNDDVYTSSDEDTVTQPGYSGYSADMMRIKTTRFDMPSPGLVTTVTKPQKLAPIKRKHIQKSNPNVLFLFYDKLLKEPCVSSLGKPLFCSDCHGARNSANSTDYKNKWLCRFCKTENLYPGGIVPKLEGPSVRYELSGTTTPNDSSLDYVIIIDKSGSMSVTVEGARSALNVLIEAIGNVLEEIAKKSPKSKVGLILVNDYVDIIGDCNSPHILIEKLDVLSSEKELREIAGKAKKTFFSDPITKSKDRLKEMMMNMKEGGQTALGPAIVCGLEILSDHKRSRMMIYTDGASNIGIGDIEHQAGVDKVKERKYYADWTKQAREKGTEIYFFPIEAANFDNDLYIPMARGSEGKIYDVDPKNILKGIGLVEEKVQIGSTSEVIVVLPKVLKLWRFLDENFQLKPNVFKKQYGSLTEKTKDRIQFVVNPKEMPRKEVEELKSLPIQVQIKWTSDNGKWNLLIYTKLFPIVNKRPKELDMKKLKELIIEDTKEMVIQNKQDNAIAEIVYAMNENMSNEESPEVKGMKNEATDLVKKVADSKFDRKIRTELVTDKFKIEGSPTTNMRFKTTLFK